MPDTQNYTNSSDNIEYFRDQTEWIAEYQDELNIVHATHLGDVVDDGSSQVQWERAAHALEPLKGEISLGINDGNHDRRITYDKTSGVEDFKIHCRDFYEEEDSVELGPDELCVAQVFSTGHGDLLALDLEWAASDEAIKFAQQQIDDHGLPTLMKTHSYLEKDSEGNHRSDEVSKLVGQGNHGEHVFNELVEPNNEIFMVLCGHRFGGGIPHHQGEYHQVSRNDEGQKVIEILSDFQNRENGGNGWMNNITFLPGKQGKNDEISVTTYSPPKGANQVDRSSHYRFQMDFEERFDLQ